MRIIRHAATALIGFLISVPAFAEWVNGEIRRLDPAGARMTIKHDEIKSLDMPPMTMVFQVRDPRLFEGLKPQDVIEFQAITEGQKYVVTAIRRKP